MSEFIKKHEFKIAVLIICLSGIVLNCTFIQSTGKYVDIYLFFSTMELIIFLTSLFILFKSKI